MASFRSPASSPRPAVALSLPARDDTQTEKDAIVKASRIAIFYHDLGHPLSDIPQLPVFGQEEDAADVASILLIDWMSDKDTANDLAYGAALGFPGGPTSMTASPGGCARPQGTTVLQHPLPVP